MASPAAGARDLLAGFRISGPAQADIASILKTSKALHGEDASLRYRNLLASAFRRIAADADGRNTLDRRECLPGLRSLHIRHERTKVKGGKVADPSHVVFFRTGKDGVTEIVRVLHERMEPGLHLE